MLTLRFNGPTERYVATVLAVTAYTVPQNIRCSSIAGLEVYEETRLSLEEAIHTAASTLRGAPIRIPIPAIPELTPDLLAASHPSSPEEPWQSVIRPLGIRREVQRL